MPCTYRAPDRSPTPGGTTTIGFSITGSRNGLTAELVWAISPPMIGFTDFGVTPDGCILPAWSGALAESAGKQKVPMSTFTDRGPHTLSFSAAATPSVEGSTATVQHRWTYTITFQRMD